MSTQIVKKYNHLFNSKIDLILCFGNVLEVKNADVLINPTGSKLGHSSGCSKEIVNASGSLILNDFETYLKEHNNLNYDQLLVTNSYNLNSIYKKIISVNSPKQHNYSIKTNTNNNNNNQLNLIQNIFLNILNKIFIQLDFKSFAMPLIGTGRNKVPLNDCILNLLETIQYFISNNNNLIQSNKQIIIIDNNLETINQLVKLIDSKLTPTITTTIPVINNNNNNNNDNTCVICMDTIGSEAKSYEKKLDKCGHSFCSICIDNYFNNVKKQCPICLTIYGVNYGNQPDGGTMTTSIINKSLPGSDSNSNTIQIQYSFSSGIQNATHPNPGKPYSGTMRTAYLPDTLEGRKVLVLLKKSFDLKQTFTIGMSRTTGVNNTITWNDIHHKTSIHGGPSNFGYPDPDYLNRVTLELAAKGIV